MPLPTYWLNELALVDALRSSDQVAVLLSVVRMERGLCSARGRHLPGSVQHAAQRRDHHSGCLIGQVPRRAHREADRLGPVGLRRRPGEYLAA